MAILWSPYRGSFLKGLLKLLVKHSVNKSRGEANLQP